MNKACLYCGTEMDCKRLSKKYCSDNCKQLAYFKRNGLQLNLSTSESSKDDVKAVNEKIVDNGNEISNLLDEVALRVIKILDLRKKQTEMDDNNLCKPMAFGIQKFNSERSEQ